MAEERVLVVDDEAAVRGVIATLLERGGYRVETAAGASAALHRMREDGVFDLVLCDVMMPELDGLSLLEAIGMNFPGTPVVMVTAMHDIHIATSAFRRGAIDYLLKPFDRARLLSVVTEALEHGRLKRQNYDYRQNLEDLVLQRTARLRATMLDLERSYDITLEAMGDALDLRDAETEGHSKRVTAYTIALAQAVGLGSEELRVIARGAFLHDIGKIATPDSILLKPGKLDERETSVMREHCQRGYDMVRKIPFLEDASAIVYAHQEHFDGSGYPRGLLATEIPLGARIFAVADTLDAITSDRPYRTGRTFEEARSEIARCAGGQFDPEIVEIFLRMPLERWRTLRQEVSRMSVDQEPSTLYRLIQEGCRPIAVDLAKAS